MFSLSEGFVSITDDAVLIIDGDISSMRIQLSTMRIPYEMQGLDQ